MTYKKEPPWKVSYTAKARKQKEKLPPDVAAALYLLQQELSYEGPEQPEWRNYGKLAGKGKRLVYHCHLNSGKPRYVAVWTVTDKKLQLIEVRYAGTHENADYRLIG